MSVYTKLFPWQRKIVDQFKDRETFGIFLDMGLGKTPLSLAFAEINNCNKILIITLDTKVSEPEDKEGSWQYWIKSLPLSYITVIKKVESPLIQLPTILLINYESLFIHTSKIESKKKGLSLSESIMKFINNCNNDNVAIIIDESHKMKDLQSKQTKSIMKIQRLLKLKNKVYTYLLTGTPFTTGYVDLYSQLKALGYPEIKQTFKDRFCILGNIKGLLGWQQPIVGYRNKKELFELVHKYALTIESEEVVELPEKIIVKHVLPQSDSFYLFTNEKIPYNRLQYELVKRTKGSTYVSAVTTLENNPFYRNIAYPELKWIGDTTGIFWLRGRELSIGFQGNAEEYQWFDTHRLEELEKFLKENNDNYLIFYNFVPELVKIYEICEKLGYNIDIYSGDIKSTYFYDKYEKQDEDSRLNNHKNVIIANFATGSTAKNWQLYNKCILFSIPLFKDYRQGIKRVHRIGQHNSCIYHLFYQDNWLDQKMQEALMQGIDYNEEMFKHDLERVKGLIKNET